MNFDIGFTSEADREKARLQAQTEWLQKQVEAQVSAYQSGEKIE